jgi:lipopolysaccharide biosynthesis glycosyltransferase
MNLIVTALDDRYLECGKAFLQSMKVNSCLEENILIFHFDAWTLSETSQKILKKVNDKVIFKEIKFENYEKCNKNNPKFLSLECWNLPGYDKVLFIDADMLCVESLQGIFNLNFPLGMVREEHRNQYNAGFILINKELINRSEYIRLLNHQKNPDTFGNDQAVINECYAGRISDIELKYNKFNIHWEGHAAMIHYIVKAYNSDFARMPPVLRDLWYNYINEANQCVFQ